MMNLGQYIWWKSESCAASVWSNSSFFQLLSCSGIRLGTPPPLLFLVLVNFLFLCLDVCCGENHLSKMKYVLVRFKSSLFISSTNQCSKGFLLVSK